MTDHLISIAKRDNLSARRRVAKDIHDKEVYEKLFGVLIHRYADRAGGFARIFRIGPRQGDNAEIALVKLIA